MLDIRGVSTFADYFVICSAESERQVKAIYDAIGETLSEEGVVTHHHEGTPDSGWVLLDLGAVIVHIFIPRQREYYELEKLWDKALPVVRFL